MSNQIDHNAYGVRIKRVEVEGALYWRGTVEEFPNLEVYEATEGKALKEIRQVLLDAIEHLKSANLPVPLPKHDNPAFSGRVTLRIPPRLHEQLDAMATLDGCSLNQLIATELAKAVERAFMGIHSLGHRQRESRPALPEHYLVRSSVGMRVLGHGNSDPLSAAWIAAITTPDEDALHEYGELPVTAKRFFPDGA